jgi:nucleoside permease NupC
MAPERRNELAQIAFRALFAATLASCMNGAVVGIVA